MKQNRRVITMVGTLCALILLFAVYKAAASMNEARERKEAEEAAKKEAVTMIAEYNYRDAVTLSYQKKGEEEISMRLDDSRWIYVPDPTLPLKQQTVAYMANALSDMGADSVVNLEGADTEAFGLSDPAWTFSISYEDGTACTYKMGNYNEFSKSYYFQKEGAETVYLVVDGLTDFFEYDLHTLADAGAFPVLTEDRVVALTVAMGDETRRIDAQNEAEESIAGEFLLLHNTLQPSCFAEHLINDETLAKYGLDTSDTTVSFHYTETITASDTEGASSDSTVTQERAFTLKLGGDLTIDGETYTAYTVDGYLFIYYMPKATAESLLTYFAAAE